MAFLQDEPVVVTVDGLASPLSSDELRNRIAQLEANVCTLLR
jgi:hypothetical protein